MAKKTTDDSVAAAADEASIDVIGGLDEMNRRLTELLLACPHFVVQSQ